MSDRNNDVQAVAAKQIVSRDAHDEFDAWKWANVAAKLGWRVVTVLPLRGQFLVWAEAPVDADPDEWDLSYYGKERP